MRHRINLLDTWVDTVELREVSECIIHMVQTRNAHQIVTVNVDFLRLGGKNPVFRDLMNTADLVVADGMPLLWAARLSGTPLPQRITGVELILTCAELAATHGYRIFLLGAAPGIADGVAAVLRARFPGLGPICTYAPPPPLTAEEEEKTIQLIQEMNPDMLFVAFGAPKQDEWIRRNMQRLGVPVSIGVGGSFDMLAGRIRRAPLWMQRHGLEWFYRLLQEPGRLWKRYLVHDLPVFIQLMIRARRPTTAGTPIPSLLLCDEIRQGLAGIEDPVTRVG